MRLILLCLIFCSPPLFAQQTVPEVQKPLVTKVTATWCPPCGSWGWDLFENLVEDNSSSAVLIAGHYRGSDLETTAGNELAENFGVSGQPSFYLGNSRQSASSGSAPMARTDIKSAVDNASAIGPVANTAIMPIAYDPATKFYTFETTTTFFQAASGEYSLSVYAVEDDVVNSQASRGADAIHKRVLRGEITGQGTFGGTIVSGNVSADQSFSSTFSLEFPMVEWKEEDLHLVLVIWKKNGSTYEFVNANEIDRSIWDIVSGTADALVAEDYRITGFSESGVLTSTIDLAVEEQDVFVELFDANGQRIASRRLGITPFGKTQIIWSEALLITGVYAVRLTIGNRSITETVLVQ